MKIVELRECTVPLQGNISNALVNFSSHSVSLIAVITDVVRNGQPVSGIAFNSIGRFAQGGLLRERFFPRLMAAPAETLLKTDSSGFDPAKVLALVMANEKPGGHGDRAAAVGGLELAFWDLNSKLAGEPAYRQIAASYGNNTVGETVPVYAAGGYYHPQKRLNGLVDELKGYQDLGFQDFKIKIGGASLSEDIKRLEAAIKIAGSSHRIAVDANGRFDLETAQNYARELAEYELRWFEEPGDPLDFELNRHISKAYVGPIATGENLFSTVDTLNLVRYGGMRTDKDIFQMDPGLSYGLTEFARMLGVIETAGHSRSFVYPHGGHMINLHVVLGLGLGGCEAYPGVFQPFGGYASGCLDGQGRARAIEAPGFGLEAKPGLKPWIDRLLA
ncbi:MAG: mandelate racemase [Gammaproteobacteria bacterium]|jgi:D(-)-tartrate dehydratase|nr:mandelate racemase [Gammaproteobacteria bacterium]MBT5204350.1 mandelate racemase [Gammaproteobacteria bacterium]MBT5604243.1 mandelate racemase [Gammaproteobacteria bacterium]MBT6247304.1 mandelate racemase [Gammaproteobacteria bacterium]